MSAQWEELRKQGDFIIVKDTPIKNVRSAVRHWLDRNYSINCVYGCMLVSDGVFVVLADVPEGAVEAFDANREATRVGRIDQLTRLREDGKLKGSVNIIAEDAERKAALAQAQKEFDEAEDPFEKYDGNDEDD